MRKWSKEFACQRCGRKFTQTFGDAILPKDQKLMQYPLCRRCQFLSRSQGKLNKMARQLKSTNTPD